MSSSSDNEPSDAATAKATEPKKKKLLIPPPLCPLKSGGIDIWRDSPMRYMGYANEVGESFRPIYPRYVIPSYGIAFLYVIADTGDKGISSYKAGEGMEVALKRGSDAFIWQSLASVIIPGKVIYMITAGAQQAVASKAASGFFSKRPMAMKWTPTICGLASIPFIIKPIDQFVDYVMDETLRKFT